tara:strand:+ start:1412 stop:2278 length:867 start_codon:yes stop_codon:yes gene_type:complete
MSNTNNNNNNNNSDIIRELFYYLNQQQTFYSNFSHNQNTVTNSIIDLIRSSISTTNPYRWNHNNTPHSVRNPFHFRSTQNNEGIFSRRHRTNNNPLFTRRNFRQSPIRFPRRDNTNLPGLPNLQTFINNTLFSSTRNVQRPTIRNIISNVTFHSWRNIKDDNNINQETCPIAVRRFNDDDIVAKISHCQHCFLYDKLLEWFDNDNRCPICRYNISSLVTPVDASSNRPLNISSMRNIDLSNNFTQTDTSDNNIIAEFSFNIPPNLNLSHLFNSNEPPTAFEESDDTDV